MPFGQPSFQELLQLLRDRPGRQAIPDDRYWAWDARVSDVLSRVPDPDTH